MMKFTKLEAIEEMEKIGSHSIFLEDSEELVKDICEPFNIAPVWETFTPSKNNPKGPMPSWDDQSKVWDYTPFKGVDGFYLAKLINRACDGNPSSGFGRGYAYRQDLANAKAALDLKE
jgi:hypothetical protein